MPDSNPAAGSEPDWHPEFVTSRRSCTVTLVVVAVAALGLLLLSLTIGAMLAVASQYLSTLLGVGVVELVLASAAALITLTLTLCAVIAVVLQREHGSDDARMARAVADIISSQSQVSAPKRHRRRAAD